MALPAASSMDWFVTVMRLYNHGLTPTVTPSEFMPSKQEVAEFWGPKVGHGYTFHDQGVVDFATYVEELFPRVLQMPWPRNGVMPFHFARGLLAEAMGVEVNWALFAFRVTHMHQSTTGVPRLLPEFANLTAPLPPLNVIMPLIRGKGEAEADDVEMESEQDIHMGGGLQSVQPNIPNNGAEAKTPGASTPPIAVPADDTGGRGEGGHAPAQISSFRRGETVNTEDAVPEDVRKITVDVINAMIMLRGSLTSSVEHERTRLTMSCIDVGNSVKDIRRRLHEERDRMRYMERKVAAKSDSHERAASQLIRAHQVLEAASIDDFGPARSEQKARLKLFIKICEKGVQTWRDNCAVAHSRLQSWEFKLKRQTERVTQVTKELEKAEVIAKEKQRSLDTSLRRLRALASFLGSL